MNTSLGARVAHDTDSFARAFASPGVGLGALTTNGESAQMTHAAVAFDTLQTLEVHADFAAKIAFDDVFAILNGVDNLRKLLFGQILGANAGIDLGVGEDHFGVARSNTVNVAQGDIDALIGRDFYSDDACHIIICVVLFPGLALALFVTGVGTNHPDDAFAADDFAIFAKLLY